MASRTPGLQGRSQYHRDWGNFTALSLLPNASGAPLAAADFVLEAGDTAYVDVIGFCYCVSPGGAGLGDAVWRRLDERIIRATSFSTLNYYEGLAGQLPGGTTMTVAVWVRHRTLLTVGTDVYFFGTYRRFAGNGWAIGHDGLRPFVIITDGGPAIVNSGGAGPGWQGNGIAGGTTATLDWGALTDAIYHLVYGSGTLSIYLNGTLVRSLGGLTGFTASGVAPILGAIRNNAGGPVQPFNGAIAGAAYTGAVAFTEAQVLDHVFQSFNANRLVDGGAGFQNLYSFDGLASAPASLTDQIGAISLTRVGAPTIERSPARYL